MVLLLKWFLVFIIYSFIGWIYESTLCSFEEKEIVNRGFLNGPIIPIYGFGAVLVVLALSGFKDNYILLFFLGALLTCSLEYLTSYLMEVLFHARWWDYSRFKYNINGRVCLVAAVAFGMFSVVVVSYVHPFVIGLVNKLSTNLIYILSAVAFFITLNDLYFTVTNLLKLNGKMAEIESSIDEFVKEEKAKVRLRREEVKQILVARFESSEFHNGRIEKLLNNHSIQTRRMTKAYPRMYSNKYTNAMIKIREQIKNKAK